MRLSLLIALLLAAGGCGLKGDLYLPDEEPKPPAAQPTDQGTGGATESEPADEEDAP